MRIKLESPYKTIATLETAELSDFALLIGRNGAGKTQLLEALRDQHASILDVGGTDIEMYDMASFRPPNTTLAGRSANQFATMTADAYLATRPDGPRPIDAAEEIFFKHAAESERASGGQSRDGFVSSLREDIRQFPDFRAFARNHASPYLSELYSQVLEPLLPVDPRRGNRRSPNQSAISFGGDQAALLCTAMKIAGKFPHELTRDDIMRAGQYEGNTIANSLSEVFTAYKVEQFIWAHKRIETEYVEYANLIAEYQSKQRPPWDTMREILSEMRERTGQEGLFNFDFSDPDNHNLDMGSYEQFAFKAELTNRSTGTQYEIDSLSSGERVLMALCLASFNQYLGRRIPGLLLLDELDAVLHPSMAAALVSTLKSLFVSQGTKVLMTSHSPMTVAALDETDIFRVARKGTHVTVSRTTKAEAIEELSEGLATVDVGLRIAAFDEAKVTILTEGNNTKHLKRWAELYYPNEVRVFEGLERYTSSNQLVAYGRLLGWMTTNTHFIIVWDCDASDKVDELQKDLRDGAKVTPFAFTRRPGNTITRKGIENNYDESILKPFSINKTDNDGTLLGSDLPKDRKSKFAEHILQQGVLEDFIHFEDLRAVVGGILESAS